MSENEYQNFDEIDNLVQGYKIKPDPGISNLSMTKYKYLVSKGLQVIHPPLPLQQSRFVSSQQLLQMDKTIVEKLENEEGWLPYRERLFKNNSQHSIRSRNDHSSSKIYTGMDEIVFQLGHNKAQMKHQSDQLTQLVEQYSQQTFNSAKPPKRQKIKCYPSRLNNEGQVLNKYQPKVIEMVTENTIPTFYLNWIETFYGKWKPPMREGASLCVVQDKYYLYGGISAIPFNDINVWDGYQWKQLDIIDNLPYGRTNHVAAIYRKNIYIFGGQKPFDNAQKIRESLNDLRCYNTETNELKVVRTSGEGVESRRGHACTFVGRHFIVMGGINTKSKYLQDVFHYDVISQKIGPANIETCNYFQNGISYHTIVAVYNPNKLIQLYKFDFEDAKEQKSKIEGVYLFGGEDKFGQLYSGFYMLNTTQRPMYWTEVQSKGIQPCARYKHTCTYFEKQQLIIIFGGISQDSTFLCDCHIFKVDSQSWCNVELEKREGRAGHCAAQDDNKLLIFGGYNQNGFLKADIIWLELDATIQVKFEKSLDTTKREKLKEKVKKQEESERLAKLREQIELLSFKGMKSYIPMPLVKARSRTNLWKSVQSKKSQMLSLKLNEDAKTLIRDFNNE